MELKHADFSPSKFEQYRLCPGSYKMQLGLPDVQSIFAKEGAMLHDAVRTGKFDGLNAEQIAVVESCRKLVEDLTIGHYCDIYYEVKLEIRDESGELITYGYADVVIDYHGNGEEDKCVVIDWKFGYTEVKDAGRNLQVAGYSLGAMQKFNKSKCTAIIFQPRIRKQTEYTFTNRTAIIANYNNIILQCKSDTIMLNACDDACRYCKARMSCPAFRIKYQKMEACKGDAELFNNPVEVERLYDEYKSMKPYFAEIEAALKHFLDTEGKCGKYTYTVTEGNREIKDPNACYERVEGMLTNKEFNAACKVSVSKLENMLIDRLVAESGGTLKKTEAKKQVAEMLQDYITRGNPVKKITVA